MRHLSRRVRRAIAGTVVTAAVLAPLVPPGASAAASSATARPATGQPAPSTPVPVPYSCFVTFPGGSTFVNFGLTFDTSAPATARRWRPFRVVVDTPPITPNPTLQSDVRDVEVVFALPDNAVLLAPFLTGGSGLGGTRPTVEVDGDVVRLKAAGPFPAGTVFDLPALNLLLLGDQAGTVATATGGTGFDDPSFSWVRNSLSPGDPPGTLRPFDCQPPAPVTFTQTAVS